MKKVVKSLVVVGMIFSITACSESGAEGVETTQNSEVDVNEKIALSGDIEVIQFHSENRCMTCNKIEANTLETLKNIDGISFRLVNVDDDANEAESEKFEAAGTALFLHNTKTGDKKELTDFAFMNAQDADKYVAKLREEIVQFGN
ncbi:MAG: hypothetical protein JJT77_11755 [Crocinitomicaceae bacterium]|nr:hypothetical protein [Crocinitomicaceae bacterium]